MIRSGEERKPGGEESKNKGKKKEAKMKKNKEEKKKEGGKNGEKVVFHSHGDPFRTNCTGGKK